MLQDSRYYMKKLYKSLSPYETMFHKDGLINIESNVSDRCVAILWMFHYAVVSNNGIVKQWHGGRAKRYALRYAYEILAREDVAC